MPYLLWPWWWWWWHSDEVLVVVFDEEELLRSRLVDEDTRCPAHSRSTPFMATIHDEWRWGGRWSRQQWGQWRPPWGRWQEDHCCHYWPTAFFAPIAYHGKASHKHKADDKVTSCLHLLDRLIKKTASPSSFSAGPAHPMIQQSHYPLSLPHPSIVCTRSWYVSIIMATKIDCCWLFLGLGSVHAYSPVGSSHHYEGAAGRSGWERLTSR